VSVRKTKSSVSIRTGNVDNSVVIGVQEGPTTDELKSALRGELQPLLALVPSLVDHLHSDVPESQSIYVCSSAAGGAGLGFAVNNSGVIVRASAVGAVISAADIRERKPHDAEPLETKRMLQAVSINTKTRGLVPAYRSLPKLHEKLLVWDAEGTQVPVTVDAVHVTIKVLGPDEEFVIRDGFLGRFDPKYLLIGGPAMTASEEVLGVVVGGNESGLLVIQPWSELGRCIDMEAS
jgi:hypothetical protein